MKVPRVLIAASGTGGHLLPAVQIAAALKEECAAAEILFVGSGRPLEAAIVDSRGFQRVVLPTVGVKNRGLTGIMKFLWSLPRAWRVLAGVFADFRPNVVVGVGGYVSVLPVVRAWMQGIPTLIHEAEIDPGLANRALSYFATRISVAFPNATIPCKRKIIFSGQPLRPELLLIDPPRPLNGVPRKMLVLGGSQGAASLDRALPELGGFLRERGVEVWHQCRASSEDEVRAAYQSAGVAARVAPFVEDMSAAYAWSDLIVARAGAGTVMEICVVRRPTVFVPYPHAQGDHQTKNARYVADRGCALIVPEGAEFSTRLCAALDRMLDAQEYAACLSAQPASRPTDAASTIAKAVLELLS